MRRIASLSTLFVALAAVAQPTSIEPIRLLPSEIAGKESFGAGAGTSGVPGIRTTVLLGDPSKSGLYTVRLSIPPNTSIQAHIHRDDRSAVVISGVWHFRVRASCQRGRNKGSATRQFLY
jgi:hypothetical protein